MAAGVAQNTVPVAYPYAYARDTYAGVVDTPMLTPTASSRGSSTLLMAPDSAWLTPDSPCSTPSPWLPPPSTLSPSLPPCTPESPPRPLLTLPRLPLPRLSILPLLRLLRPRLLRGGGVTLLPPS